ncbi:uncharacterized protein LOC120201481 [Hibiscus syriacus]|uniref:uncharacterized protein LOC120201481 n=1 Tax=Hibiscus syriacus TaxID=106335 RepID=UPI0019241A9A|nr:uncharacterized protein LOC120201481 [Hibiscus syriacus]
MVLNMESQLHLPRNDVRFNNSCWNEEKLFEVAILRFRCWCKWKWPELCPSICDIIFSPFGLISFRRCSEEEDGNDFNCLCSITFLLVKLVVEIFFSGLMRESVMLVKEFMLCCCGVAGCDEDLCIAN